MRKILPSLGAVLLLSACGGGAEEAGDTAAMAEGGEAVADAASGDAAVMKAGEWEMTVNAMGQETKTTTCVTEEMAADPASFGGNLPEGCEGDGIAMEGGKITAAMTCNQGGQEMAMTMDGMVSAEDYTMDTAIEIAGQTMETNVIGKRIGDCPA